MGKPAEVKNCVIVSLTEPSFVGRCPEAEVTIKDKVITCIVDSGSQVTLFSYSLFQKFLSEEALGDAQDLYRLKLTAANGPQIPYVGYVVADMEPGRVKLLNKGIVISHGVLGMNVIKDCWRAVFQGEHPGAVAFKSKLPATAGPAWNKAFVSCRWIQTTAAISQKFQGIAKLPRQVAVQLAPETEMIVWVNVPEAAGVPDCKVMVEDMGDSKQEYRVARTLCHLQNGKIPVEYVTLTLLLYSYPSTHHLLW